MMLEDVGILKLPTGIRGKLLVWDSKRRALKSPIPFIKKNNKNPTIYH